MLENIKKWLWEHNIPQPIALLVIVMLLPIIALILWAIPGIVGNRADQYLENAVAYLAGIQSVPGWLPVLLLLLVYIGVIIALVVTGQLISRRTQAEGRYRRANKVLELSLLQLAVMVRMLEDRSASIDIENILKDHLAACVDAFLEGVYRAAIFRPNIAGDYLEVWSHFGYVPDRLPNRRYCISPTYTGRRGVAGYAFLEGVLDYDRIRRQADGKWMGEHAHFVPSGNAMHEPKYKSFVAVPIKDVLGAPRAVMCIDSDRVDAFDDVEDLYMLDNMASAIGPIILAYYEIVPADARQ